MSLDKTKTQHQRDSRFSLARFSHTPESCHMEIQNRNSQDTQDNGIIPILQLTLQRTDYVHIYNILMVNRIPFPSVRCLTYYTLLKIP